MNKSARIIGALAAAATIPLMTQGTAAAASAQQSFNINTQSGGTYAGYAKASGWVSFGSRTRFNIGATVTDVCPKDGAGAYVWVQVDFKSATTSTTGSWVSDASGCSDGSSGSTTRYDEGLIDDIVAVRVIVKECDTTSRCSTNSMDIKYSAWKYNPYV